MRALNILFVLAAFTATSGFAQVTKTNAKETLVQPTVETAAVTQEQEQKLSGFSEFTSHMHANLFTNFRGPALNRMDSGTTVDQNGKTSNQAMFFDSEISTPYMFSDTVGVGPIVPFYLYATRGEGFSIGDVGVRVFNRRMITTSNLIIGDNLALQLPTSTSSSARGMTFALKTTPNIRYVLQNTRFTFGAWTEAKAYFGVNSGKTFKLWAEPYVAYQVSPKFTLNLGYEMETDHLVGQKSLLDMRAYQSDLIPGFTYMISPSVMINPYLQIFTTQNVSTDRMALGAIVTASL